MIDKETPVDTAELRRLLEARDANLESFSVGTCAALLDEIDALRAKAYELDRKHTQARNLVADFKRHARAKAYLWKRAERSRLELIEGNKALRAKLAESEAACAVLADAVKEAGRFGYWDDSTSKKTLMETADHAADVSAKALVNLPASVRAHMEEDAALRAWAAAAKFVKLAACACMDPTTGDQCAYHAAEQQLDAVRAKGAG